MFYYSYNLKFCNLLCIGNTIFDKIMAKEYKLIIFKQGTSEIKK